MMNYALPVRGKGWPGWPGPAIMSWSPVAPKYNVKGKTWTNLNPTRKVEAAENSVMLPLVSYCSIVAPNCESLDTPLRMALDRPSVRPSVRLSVRICRSQELKVTYSLNLLEIFLVIRWSNQLCNIMQNE